MRIPSLSACLLAAVALLLGNSAHACSCIAQGPVCAAYFEAPVVVRGTVVSITLEQPAPATMRLTDGSTLQVVGGGILKVRIAINEQFRGAEGQQELIVYTNEEGSACGFPFSVGAEYVVFANHSETDDRVWASHCSRTHAVQNAATDPDLAWMRSLAAAPAGARLFGRVSLGRTEPMPGATIDISGPRNMRVATDADGRYQITSLPPGEYRLTASMPAGFVSYPAFSARLSDKGCAERDWFASYDAHVRGRVVDARGKPLAGISVDLIRQDAQSLGRSTMSSESIREDGSYDFSDVVPGRYVVVVNRLGATPTRPYGKWFYPGTTNEQGALAVNVAPSVSVDGIDIAMPPPWKKIVVTARIVDANGLPMAGSTVNGYEVDNQSTAEPMSAVTGADGSVALPVYEGREYYLTAFRYIGSRSRCAGPLRFIARDGITLSPNRARAPVGQLPRAVKSGVSTAASGVITTH